MQNSATASIRSEDASIRAQEVNLPQVEANVPQADANIRQADTNIPQADANLRFEDVSVAFGDRRSALRDVTFEIRSGQRLALVGPSGGGKSTVASLLLRFIDPDQGEIWVGNRRLADIPAETWRAKIAWVPQSPYLLNDTVEANIRLARPEASQEQVIQAARQAEADEFIQALPQGYDTPIGERGVRLSGGEAQRIALARAFLKDASLVILDEATANLDPENEARLQNGMRRLMAGRTVLVIAHRLNTVAQADRIIVLERGKVRPDRDACRIEPAGGSVPPHGDLPCKRTPGATLQRLPKIQ